MSARPSLYELALGVEQNSLADQLVLAMVDEALSDPEWRRLYDRVHDDGVDPAEAWPALLAESRVEKPGRLLIDQPGLSPLEASWKLLLRAGDLGAPVGEAAPLQAASAVVGAELWLAAHGVETLELAVSLGPDAVRSAGALLARASGQPAPWSETRCRPAPGFPIRQVGEAIEHCRQWVSEVLGPGAWGPVRTRASSDLRYQAYGASASAAAAAALEA